MNEYNANGERHGYWEEDYRHLTHKGFYVNGKEHGLWQSVDARPIYIRWTGYYDMGNAIGFWQHYDEYGKLYKKEFYL